MSTLQSISSTYLRMGKAMQLHLQKYRQKVIPGFIGSKLQRENPKYLQIDMPI